MAAPIPSNENERLLALKTYRILDTAEEFEFNHYTRMVATLCDTEIGAMTLIDSDRQWVKAVHGPLARSVARDHAFCPHTILQTDILEVPDARLDPRFANSSLVLGAPFVRFYAGVALVTRDGAALGTLCVLDSKPKQLTESQRRVLILAAAHIAAQLELRRSVLQLVEQKKLAAECRLALSESNHRQQDLTAMLVHDLKSPLTAVGLNASWLAEDQTLTTAQQDVAQEIVEASQTLAGMVNDLLDVSRAEDGQLMLQHASDVDVARIAHACIEGSRKVAAERDQRVELVTRARETLIECDPKIITRVINNLIENAYKYAPRASNIVVELSSTEVDVVVRVIDEGRGIPLAQREAVFEKYFQVEHSVQERPSHGLGLAFCRLAIEAHQGTIAVEDHPTHCVFCVHLPKAPARAAMAP